MSDNDYKIGFTFSRSIENVRKFAIIGRKIIESFWPQANNFAFEVELSLVEALSNVLFHTLRNNSQNTISYQIKISSSKLVVRVFDQGEGFCLSNYFAQKKNLYQTNGRGLQLINGFMDDLKYIRGRNRNELVFEKALLFLESESVI